MKKYSISSMTRTMERRPRLGVAASLSLVAALSLTGCYSAAEQDWDAIAAGEDGVIGSVELLSFLLVARDEGAPGRLLGALNNESDTPVDVTISDGDDEVVIIVPADSQYPLDTDEVSVDTVDDAPGALTSITASTLDETEALSVPVMDGTLERYEPYLPE